VKEEAASSISNVHGRLHDNFWIAYDALDLG
jgi:cell division control protein 45